MDIAQALIILKMAFVGVATTFSAHNDPWNPNSLCYCTDKVMDDNALIAAHPKLPCGSKVYIYAPRTKKGVTVTILDRGPRSADLDLSPGAAKAIGANGYEPIVFIPEVDGQYNNPRLTDIITQNCQNKRCQRFVKTFNRVMAIEVAKKKTSQKTPSEAVVSR